MVMEQKRMIISPDYTSLFFSDAFNRKSMFEHPELTKKFYKLAL